MTTAVTIDDLTGREAAAQVSLGGFVSFVGELAKERIAYRVLYTELRTRTYAFSHREQGQTEYWLAQDRDAPKLVLGTEAGLASVPYFGYTGRRYG